MSVDASVIVFGAYAQILKATPDGEQSNLRIEGISKFPLSVTSGLPPTSGNLIILGIRTLVEWER